MENKILIGLGILIAIVLVSGCVELQKEPLRIELKDLYEIGEEIEIKVINDLEEPIYIYSKDYPYYKIYKLDNDTWNELSLFISYGCLCENETLHCPLLIPELPKCTEIKDETALYWDQEINPYTFAKCGNETYKIWGEEIADPGTYKVKFCYYKKEDVDLYEESCDIIGNATCIEKEFERNRSDEENCGEYKRNGVVEIHCAICEDGICEDFERCTSSFCDGVNCSGDCGPLYCQQDCGW